MKRRFAKAALIVLGLDAAVGIVMLLVAGNQALAASRSYSLPTDQGQAISACLTDGTSCGKPAADQFCKMAGYREAILFQRTAVISALTLDSDFNCQGETCQAFTRIKCYTPVDEEQASVE